MIVLEVAPAAPLVPAAAGFAAALFLLLAWVVVMGLRQGYDATFGMFLRVIADELRGIRFIGGFLAGRIDSVDHFIMGRLADAADALQTAAAKLFHASEWLVKLSVDTTVELAHATKGAIDSLVDRVIPGEIHARTVPLARGLDHAERVANARDAAEAQTRARGIDRVQGRVTHEAQARARGIDDVGARLGSRLDAIRSGLTARVDAVSDFAHGQLAGRLGRIETFIATGAIAGIAFRVLTRTIPWARCSNVNRAGKALCRMDLGALDALLLGTTVIAGGFSLVALAEDLLAVEDEIVAGLERGIRELHGA